MRRASKVIEEIARQISDDVWVVAPELDQSGVSHSLSLNDPLRLREVGPRHFAVRGTPTDCVIMGSRHILGDKGPDLVLSGVNKGRNVAEDVVYSGTIAGALEGTILGLPSFALSQEFSMETRNKPLWDTALKFGPDVIRNVMKLGVPRDTVINVNFPSCMPDEVKGILVTKQGKRNQGFLRVDGRRDGPRQSILLDRLRKACGRRCAGGGDRSRGTRRSLRLGHAVAAGPHRRCLFRKS